MVEVRRGVQWYDAGYTDIVSVIPPGVGLVPRSKISPDSLGKTPGLRFSSGLWGGYAWRDYTLSRKEVERVDATGANIGLKATRFPAIDLDMTSESLVEAAAAVLEKHGIKWYRIGRAPKRLYPCRLEGKPFGKMRLIVRRGEEMHMVEVLAEGQQYVVAGQHPSGHTYRWSGDIVPPDSLPALSAESAKALLMELSDVLQDRGYSAELTAGGITPIPQSDLLAPSKEDLSQLVRQIPNTLESHPTRDHYIRMAAAIKAAGGDVETFWEWASRWPGRDGKRNTREQAEKDWNSLHPPFKLGWEWLLDQARVFGTNTAVFEFAALEENRAVEEARIAFPNAGIIASVRDVPVAYSDLWVADKFVRSILTLVRRVAETKTWLVWTGSTWQEDKSNFVHVMARNFLCGLSAEVVRLAEKADEKTSKALRNLAKQLTSSFTLNMVIDQASKDSRLLLPVSRLDVQKDYLNTPSGPINLRTGERMPPNPSLLLTKSTSCSVDFGVPETWMRFLEDSTCGDRSYMAYLQRVAGYLATGSTEEQAVFFVWGTGGNGKTVFVRTLQHVLGSYATVAPLDMLLEKGHSSHPVELAVLRGQRLAVVNETPSAKQWNEARLKLFAGGDMVTARRLYGDPFSFELTTRLVIVGNAKPVLSDVDDAIRRRLHLMPFVFKPAKPDHHLQQKLFDEAPKILGWVVKGAVEWYNSGLGMPPAVEEESQEYLDSNDVIGAWMKTVTLRPEARSRTVDLYEAYRSWCIEEGETPVTVKRFSSLLQNRGFKKRRNSHGQFEFEGLEVTK